MQQCKLQVIYAFDAEGGIPKVIANKLAVGANGTWLLPFWRENDPGCAPVHPQQDLRKCCSSCCRFCRRRINLMPALPLGTQSIQQGPGHDCPERMPSLAEHSWAAHWPQTSRNSTTPAPASRHLTADTIDLQVDLWFSMNPSGKPGIVTFSERLIKDDGFYGGAQGRRASVQRPAESDGRAGGSHLQGPGAWENVPDASLAWPKP